RADRALGPRQLRRRRAALRLATPLAGAELPAADADAGPGGQDRRHALLRLDHRPAAQLLARERRSLRAVAVHADRLSGALRLSRRATVTSGRGSRRRCLARVPETAALDRADARRPERAELVRRLVLVVDERSHFAPVDEEALRPRKPEVVREHPQRLEVRAREEAVHLRLRVAELGNPRPRPRSFQRA